MMKQEALLSNLSLDDHFTIVLQLNKDFLAPVISFFECVGDESFDSFKVKDYSRWNKMKQALRSFFDNNLMMDVYIDKAEAVMCARHPVLVLVGLKGNLCAL